MCAHPATKVKWNGNYLFGSDVMLQRPHLSCLVANVIAGWSVTETHLGRTLATLIGAKQPVTMSMYEAVRSFEVQRALLVAAANDVLPTRYAALFEVSLSVLTRAAQDRNKFAHWVWGASADPELDALFLVEPKHFWKLAVAQIKHWNKTQPVASAKRIARQQIHQFNMDQPKLEREHIYVYRIKDLQDARSRVERAFWIAEHLRKLASSKGAPRRAIYHRLCSEPEIQKALADRKKKAPQQKAPKPAKPRGKSDQK